MPTVSALIWKNLLMHPIYGVFGAVASMLGLQPVDWFAQFPLSSVIAIVSWEWLPFALLILLTAVQSLDHEQQRGRAHGRRRRHRAVLFHHFAASFAAPSAWLS